MNKKRVILVCIITIGIAALLAFVLNTLFKIHTDGIFMAEWDAGDALNYVSGILGAMGTIVLGYIAYKQNDKLHELENNNYIANFGCMPLINEIHIKQKPNVPKNWETHSEQIVVDSDESEQDACVGYKLCFKAQSVGNAVPALIHIQKCNIFEASSVCVRNI